MSTKKKWLRQGFHMYKSDYTTIIRIIKKKNRSDYKNIFPFIHHVIITVYQKRKYYNMDEESILKKKYISHTKKKESKFY